MQISPNLANVVYQESGKIKGDETKITLLMWHNVARWVSGVYMASQHSRASNYRRLIVSWRWL